jgi:hypothetical protein
LALAAGKYAIVVPRKLMAARQPGSPAAAQRQPHQACRCRDIDIIDPGALLLCSADNIVRGANSSPR